MLLKINTYRQYKKDIDDSTNLEKKKIIQMYNTI